MQADSSISESVKATRASEARYRIQAPNSRPRSFRVLALDAFSLHVAERACKAPQRNIEYRLACAADDLDAWLEEANIVALVVRAGTDPSLAAGIHASCMRRGIMVTGLVIEPLSDPEPAGRATIAGLRPYCSMLVVASDADYVEDMLDALGAAR